MHLNEYQKMCERTALFTHADSEGERIAYSALALGGEAGEVSNLVKKVIRSNGFKDCCFILSQKYKGPLSQSEHLKEELGDVLWYLATLANEAGMTLDEVAQFNLDKLAQRYKDGIAWAKPK